MIVRRAALALCAMVVLAGCGGSGSAPPHTSSNAATSGGAGSSGPTQSSNAATQTTAASSTTSPSSGNGTKSGTSPKSKGAQSGKAGSALVRDFGNLGTYGSEPSASSRAAVLAAFHTYLSAIAAGDWSTACAQLATPLQTQITTLFKRSSGSHAHGCAAALGGLLGRTSAQLRHDQAPTRVIAVRTEGPHAFVFYRTVDQPHVAISMLLEGGRWRAGVLSGAGIG